MLWARLLPLTGRYWEPVLGLVTLKYQEPVARSRPVMMLKGKCRESVH